MVNLSDVADECRRRVELLVRHAAGKLQIDRHFRDFVPFRENSCVHYGSGAARRKGSARLVANPTGLPEKRAHLRRTPRPPCSMPEDPIGYREVDHVTKEQGCHRYGWQ
jgi:hypothetical protein